MYNIKKHATTLLFAGIFVFCFGVFSPVLALANGISPTSGDFTTTITPTCTSNYMELFAPDGTWITYTGVGTCWGTLSPINLTTLYADGGFPPPTVSGSYHFVGSKANTTCTVNNYSVCIASGDYDGFDQVFTVAGGGGSSGTSTSPFAAFSTTTVYTVVDNPNQDFFNGILIFLIGMFGVMWFFNKKR